MGTEPSATAPVSKRNIQKEIEQHAGSSGNHSKVVNKYDDSVLATVERNQDFLSKTLLGLLYFCHICIPYAHTYTSKFLTLQYEIDNTNSQKRVYDIGIDDAYFVIHWVILLNFLRAFLMRRCLGPFAVNFCNIHSRKAVVRFSEQGWEFLYYSFSFSFGAFLYCKSPYFLHIDNIYVDWPHYEMCASFKGFYLISIAFWIQQIFVLNIEEKRKDHYQMFSHHIITCCLIIGSYYYYYGRIGNLILMIMDSVDIFLAGAKMLKYAGYSTACDFMFILFLISWIILRHGLYNYVFFHAWSKSTSLMADGKCIAGLVQRRCWTPTVINVFLGLLGGLQIITIIWMYSILKVAYKVITGTGAEDVRSDEDDTDEEFENEVADDKDKDILNKEDELRKEDEINEGTSNFESSSDTEIEVETEK